jgi:NADPH:quinone reductase-like Zn-dependent oxidoreductase
MGGLGRTRNGSYAEYVAAPATNVVAIDTALSWTDLATIPESYATAWSTLNGNLELQTDQTLVVRGATSALGQAAVNVASDLGATVIATTRRQDRAELLRSLGAKDVVVDNGEVAGAVRQLVPGGVDRVLDLVGNSVLRDSLRAVHPAGRVCQAGFLGGLAPLAQFLPIVDMPSGVQFSFFGSFELGTDAFPLSAIPLQHIVSKVERGDYAARPSRVFSFNEISEAHRVMERGEALGKLVVGGV